MDSNTFIKALVNEDIERLRSVPKTDVHNHGLFGTRIRNIEQWAGVSFPKTPRTFETLDEMSAFTWNSFIPAIASEDGVKFVFSSAILDAINDGVKYLEMSIDVRVISMFNSPPYGIINYVKELKSRHINEIIFCPELGISRDHNYQDIEPTAKECIASGVFSSIDLYGNENAQQPEIYKSLYSAAKCSGMKLKAHAGEFGSAESIRDTVNILELDEVQHGINAADSPEVMKWLARNEIQLNICPTSNVVLSRVSQMQDHPIKILFDNGIPVTINTDDLTVFDQTVSDEYLNLFKAKVLSAGELDQIRQTSLNRCCGQ